MSVKAMTRVWELDVGHSQQAVLLAMADHANDEGGEVFPSTGLIAWKSGYSKRQVQRLIDAMEESGLLEQVEESRGWRPTEYRICFEAVPLKKPYDPPKRERGDKLSPQAAQAQGRQGVTAVGRQDVTPPIEPNVTPGVTFEASRGDIQMSPRTLEPSKEPPLEGDHPTGDLLRDDLIGLSDRLAAKIRANDPKAKVAPRSRAWLDPLRLLVDRDERTVEEVERVIDASQADEFWRKNVLSPASLRRHFGRFAVERAKPKSRVGAGGVSILPQEEKDRLMHEYADRQRALNAA